MRLSMLLGSTLAAASFAVAAQAPVATTPPSPAQAYAAKFDQEVKHKVFLDENAAASYRGMLTQALQGKPDTDHEQFFVLVDRNPKVEHVMLFLGTAQNPAFVGAAPASTGSTGRKDHYITPLGVFNHQLLNDFRAQGTKNENGIRGYGSKGMRIWDFGWVPATKGWRLTTAEEGDIRFEMHATDPSILEPRLGTPASQGCVRIPEGLNKFFDHYGVLDAAYDQAVASGKPQWVLRSDREASVFSGRYLVVVDTSETPVGR